MDGYPLAAMPSLALHESVRPTELNPVKVAEDWLSSFRPLLQQESSNSLEALRQGFVDECWWRDLHGVDWGFNTKSGHNQIRQYLESAKQSLSNIELVETGPLAPFLVNFPGLAWIHFGFRFKNACGEGIGLIRLLSVGESDWKAWLIFTKLETLKNSPGPPAPLRVPSPLDSPVIIVGSGQAGLALSAQLQRLGIRSLILDQHARVGDSWRTRYSSVRLHTPKYCDHLPFLDFPDATPKWQTGAHLADFLEHYQKTLNLEVRLNTTVTGVDLDEAAKRYHIHARGKDGLPLTLTARHLVLATGPLSTQHIKMPSIPGLEKFRGTAYHSRDHVSASRIPDLGSKKVVVVGASTSGHDIAQDFVSCGASSSSSSSANGSGCGPGSVTMIQRHPIFVVSLPAMEQVVLPLWNDGPDSPMQVKIPRGDADILGSSFPVPVLRSMSVGSTRAMNAIDAELLRGLREAGFGVEDPDEKGYGLLDPQFIRGGCYYLDQGASGMIADGRIRVCRCEGGVVRVEEREVVLADGRRVEADVLVFATGFKPAAAGVAEMLGPELAARLGGDWGGLDAGQERVGWWRKTALPGFWFMTGGLLQVRQYSLSLGLQIAAIERGMASWQ